MFNSLVSPAYQTSTGEKTTGIIFSQRYMMLREMHSSGSVTLTYLLYFPLLFLN